ncbi:MAG TPA: hypothetical protein VLX92_07965 [Kofleriaceae bacterium]|nr:hypothetical protein [Kofleriaceae bacterium]
MTVAGYLAKLPADRRAALGMSLASALVIQGPVDTSFQPTWNQVQ